MPPRRLVFTILLLFTGYTLWCDGNRWVRLPVTQT